VNQSFIVKIVIILLIFALLWTLRPDFSDILRLLLSIDSCFVFAWRFQGFLFLLYRLLSHFDLNAWISLLLALDDLLYFLGSFHLLLNYFILNDLLYLQLRHLHTLNLILLLNDVLNHAHQLYQAFLALQVNVRESVWEIVPCKSGYLVVEVALLL
jgi:hypothetical protein